MILSSTKVSDGSLLGRALAASGVARADLDHIPLNDGAKSLGSSSYTDLPLLTLDRLFSCRASFF